MKLIKLSISRITLLVSASTFLFFGISISPAFLVVAGLIFFAALLNRTLELCLAILVSVFVFFAYIISVYLIISFLGINPNTFMVALPYFVGSYALLFYSSRIQQQPFIISVNLAIALPLFFLSIIACLFIFLPVKKFNSGLVITALSTGEDNASHYALYNYIYEHNHYAYFQDAETGLVKGLDKYPQGLHVVQAFLAKTIKPTTTYTAPIKTYYLLLATIYTLLVYSVGYLVIYYLRNALKSRVSRYAIWSMMPLFLIYCVGGPFLLLFTWGFHAQILAFSALATLIAMISTRNNFKGVKQPLWLVCLLLIGIVSHSWYFVLPIGIVIMSLFALPYFNSVKKIKAHGRWVIAYLVIVAWIILPILINVLGGINASHVTAEGGVAKLSGYWVAAIIFSVMSIPLLGRRIEKRLWEPLVSSTVIFSLFVIGIATYQLVTTGSLSYYFYKSLYLLVIPTLVVIPLIYGLLFTTLDHRFKTHREALWVSVVIFFTSLGFIVAIKPIPPRVYWHVWMHMAADSEQLEIILYERPSGDAVFAGGCNRVYNYINNRWTGAILLTETQKRSELEYADIRNNESDSELLSYLFANEHPQYKVLYQLKCDDPFGGNKPISNNIDLRRID